MCVATAAAIAAASAGAIGAVGAIKAGNSEANALKYNALVEQQNAQATRASAAAEAAQEENRGARRLSLQRALYGSSGVDPNQGTPLAVMADTAAQGELSKRLISYQGELQARGLEQKATLDTTQAKVARQAGLFNAASTLLSAGVRAATPLAGPSTKPAATPDYTGHGFAFPTTW